MNILQWLQDKWTQMLQSLPWQVTIFSLTTHILVLGTCGFFIKSYFDQKLAEEKKAREEAFAQIKDFSQNSEIIKTILKDTQDQNKKIDDIQKNFTELYLILIKKNK